MQATDRRGGAPIVDRAYYAPLVIGDDGVQWLRSVEIELRDLAERLEAVRDVLHPPLTLVLDAEETIERLLHDENGEVVRCARRPLSHLRPGAPGRARLERSVTDLRNRVVIALSTVDRVQALSRSVDAARSDYSASLPNFTREYLADAGLDADRFSHVRSERDIARLESRLATVVAALRELRDAADDSGEETEHQQTVADELTLTELRALRVLALRARTSMAGLSKEESLAHDTAAGLIRITRVAERMAGVAGYRGRIGMESSGTTARLLEDAAVQSLESSRYGSTASFWAGAVAAGARALNPVQGSFSWLPPLGSLANAVAAPPLSAPDAPDDSGSTIYCIPIGQSHVVLSPKIRSGIRVYSETVHPGEVLECTVTPSSEPSGGTALMDADLSQLFEGLDDRFSRWYEIGKKLRVTVLTKDGDEWYGRFEKPGVIERLPDPPVSETVPQRVPSAFRIRRDYTIGSSEALDPEDSALTVKREGTLDRVLGLQTFRVATPFERHPSALLRRPIRVSRRTTDMTLRERDLFAALSSAGGGQNAVCPAPIGLGRLDDAPRFWPCYARPPVTWPRQDDLERTWLKGDSRLLLEYIRGVARVIVLAHDRSFSVGVVTMQQFAVALDWERESGAPVPRPMLMTAPLAAAFGNTYLSPTGVGASHDGEETYSRLGVSVLPPDVAGQLQASPATDAYGFGLFVLDLLMEHPTSGSIETLPQRLEDDRRLSSELISTDVEIIRGIAAYLAGFRLDRLRDVLHLCASAELSWVRLRELTTV